MPPMKFPPRNLYELCSVCGGRIVPKLGYVNAKTCSDYIDLLRTCFGILTSEDKEVKIWIYSNIHGVPPKLWGAFWFSKIFLKGFGGFFVWKWGGESYGGELRKKVAKEEDSTLKNWTVYLFFFIFSIRQDFIVA